MEFQINKKLAKAMINKDIEEAIKIIYTQRNGENPSGIGAAKPINNVFDSESDIVRIDQSAYINLPWLLCKFGEVDKECLNYLYILENVKYDVDDFEEKIRSKGFEDEITDYYTYNYENHFSDEFIYFQFKLGHENFLALRIHLGGDARCGFSDYIIIKTDSVEYILGNRISYLSEAESDTEFEYHKVEFDEDKGVYLDNKGDEVYPTVIYK